MINERIMAILNESSKCHKSKCAKDECGDACNEYQDTIGDGHNFSDVIVPDSIKMNKDTIPVCKVECNEGAKYFIDSRVLDIYMEDNDISDDGEAVLGLCEYYNIEPGDMHVVIECDSVGKDLVDFAKDSNNYISLGLLKRSTNRIRNLVNKGICVCKSSDK